EPETRGLVQLHRELVFSEPLEAGDEAVDRIVLARQGAVPAAVGDFEAIVDVDLLRGLHAVAPRLAAFRADAAAFVQRAFRVDEGSLVLDQPADAELVGVADLLVRLEDEDDVARRAEAFLLVADEIRDEGGRHELVVAGAAAVEVAILLLELERLHRPVFAL